MSEVFDIPEVIEVETRFIAHMHQAEQAIAHTIQFDSTYMNFNPSMAASLGPENMHLITSNAPPMAPPKAVMAEVAIQTDSQYPTRDRGQQCVISNIKGISIGIQCCMDDEVSEENFAEEKDHSQDETEFLKYVQENTLSGINGKYECLICGEIQKPYLSIQKHMILHYGPPSLCFKCGTLVPQEVFLSDHKCPGQNKKRKRSLVFRTNLNLKCPFYACPVIAISRQELYDHINEHNYMTPHHCRGCNRSFSTYGELKLHKELRMKCFASKRNRSLYDLPKDEMLQRQRVTCFSTPNGRAVIVKQFLSHALDLKKFKGLTFNTPRYCHLCLQRCTNVMSLRNHVRRCTGRYKARLSRKLGEEKPKPQVNGFHH